MTTNTEEEQDPKGPGDPRGTARVVADGYPLPLGNDLVAVLQAELDKAGIPRGAGAYIHFRDPSYTAETGGFRPVEVLVGEDGRVRYVTEFGWVGAPPMCDLAKSADFDLDEGVYQDLTGVHPLNIADVRAFWGLWKSNFLAYHRLGVYSVQVEEGP